MATTTTTKSTDKTLADKRQALERELKEKLVELRAMYRRGEASLADALMIYEDEVEAIYAVGLRYLHQHKHQEAAQVLSNLCMFEPNDPRYWRSLGLALIKIERTQLAMAALEMALVIDANDLPALTYRGEQLILLGKKEDARADLEAVIRLAKPQSSDELPFLQRAKGLLRYAQTQH
jgi:tetratricopeptide (TPR) repeat protein